MTDSLLLPRILQSSYIALTSAVEEIVSFSQYDLAPEMVGVVDAHDAVFVWLGQHCCPRAKEDPRSIALAYLAQGELIYETGYLVSGSS